MSRNYTQYPVVLFNRSEELQTEEDSIAKFRVTALFLGDLLKI